MQLENPDRSLLELLRSSARTVADLVRDLGITATAVRQRLERVTALGWVEREVQRSARGRPSHRYSLTAAGQRVLGNNLSELAVALWAELRAIPDAEWRSRIIRGVAKRLSEQWGGASESGSLQERFERMAQALRDQRMSVRIEPSADGALPVLKFDGCPYPDLSAINHDICDLEGVMLSTMLGQPLSLTSCRCDSPNGSCTYELHTATDS